ncbi:hypothetical protein VCHC17A1_3987A, partial [Vibrio cholerae HC-17A1]
MFFAAG